MSSFHKAEAAFSKLPFGRSRPRREVPMQNSSRAQSPMASLLIVDNEDRIRRSLETMFRNEGFETYSTWSAHEALDLLRERGFHVIVVGDHLPDLHYPEFLRRASHWPGAYIVLMRSSARRLRRHKVSAAAAVVHRMDEEEIRRAVAARPHPSACSKPINWIIRDMPTARANQESHHS